MDRKIKVNAILVLLILFITTIGFQVKAEAMGKKMEDRPLEARVVHLPGLVVTNANETAKALSKRLGKQLVARVVNRVTLGASAFEIGIDMATGDLDKILEAGVFLALGATRAGNPVLVTIVIMEASNEALKDASLNKLLDGLENHLKKQFTTLVCHSAELSTYNFIFEAESAYERKDKEALKKAIAKIYQQLEKCPLVGADWSWPEQLGKVLKLEIIDEDEGYDDCFEKCFGGPTANNDDCRRKCAE